MLDDLGKAYEQQELAAWLAGEAVAPNGKRYQIESANPSTINRIINDRMQRPPLEILAAISEIFGRSLDWLITGHERDGNGATHDIFMTAEAGTIAKLVDRMDEPDRQCILRLCQRWERVTTETKATSRELLETQKKLLYVLDQSRSQVPPKQQAAIDELTALAERSTDRLPR